ncbi:MAG: hypothetical protein H3C47_10865 [Candidatus Cloacimonetes bacterium]|nr:hypothetical protein [Candidatus Cloacimonadota bacterium]
MAGVNFLKPLVCITCALGFIGFISISSATEYFTGEPLAIFEAENSRSVLESSTNDVYPWALIERHKDKHPRFPREAFHSKLEQFYPQTVKALGSKSPHSSVFALYAAPSYLTARHPNPVLLIHGANDDATRRYAHPKSTYAEDHTQSTGLMQHLAGAGFSVFAISFSHYHGDNIFQGEQIANAITRIRQLLGKESDSGFQVDLVTFSKGAMAARAYVQSAGQEYGMKFITPYRGDVRRIVFQCGPLGGLDTPFRYYMYNLSIASNKIPAPMGASSMLLYGLWKDMGENHIHSGFWPGQLQMIHDQRLLGVKDGVLSMTTDMNHSAKILREGGTSLFLQSDGLEKARIAGGRMIEMLNRKGLPSSVSAVIVAGTHHVIYDERYENWKIPIGAELAAPSDGLLYLASATHTEGLTAQGAKIQAVKEFPLNHIDLSRNQEVFDFVVSELKK